jgi:addiction module RelE/StbE family toxin
MRVVWRPAALTDRDTIMNRICQHNPEAAIALDAIFEIKAEQARLQPTAYRKGRVSDTREIVATRNYLIIYLIRNRTVEILRVMHARQQWPC